MKWITSDTKKFLAEGYLLPNVTPEERIREICDISEKIQDNPGFSDRFYEYCEKGWVSFSSPVWSNFGLDRGLPISCFASSTEDSTSDILWGLGETGMLTKMGGGTGRDFRNVRPRGASISSGGESNGSVSFMEMYDTMMSTISQGNIRRGSLAVFLPIDHGDIKDFLDIKSTGSNIQNLSFGVSIPEGWMQSMIDGDIIKRKVWAKVLESRSEKGYPYIFFEDNVREGRPKVYKDKDMEILHSNLCVAPNTQILTSNGYQLIGDLENEDINIWDGEEWSETKIKKTGINQKLLRVITDSGYELDCTPYHKFYIQRGYNKGAGINKLEIVKLRANELQKGDKLIKFDLPIIQGELELKNAYENGFYSGDGCLTNSGQRIYLYGEKIKLLHKFNTIEKWYNQPNQNRIYGHTNKLKDKFFVPDSSYTIESRLEWLAGYLDADGTITDNNGSQSLQATSIEKEFLKEIQLMLQTIGVDSKVTFHGESGLKKLPKNDGSGESALYNCKESSRLLINGNSLYKLSQLGFNCERLNWVIKKPNRECSQFIKIESIQELPDLSDTFCFKEPKRGMGMFNGILTGNCQEILEYTDKEKTFTCCLSSVNLLHYFEWKDTDFVKDMMYFLDSVLEDFITRAEGKPFMERVIRFAKEHRSVGLGVLGWHSLLQSRMMPFEGLQSQMLNVEIFKNINNKSLEASRELAKSKGEPEVLKGYGERFTTRCAIAPTTSSSFILGAVSPSIEPLASNYYIKGLAKGKFTYKNPFLKELLATKDKDLPEVWDSILMKGGSVQHLGFLTQDEKDVFKTFSEVSQLEVIQQAAARQPFIDQGQSLNLMIPNTSSVKDINSLIIEAWKLGIKTLYYQRSTNAAQEVARTLMNCVSCEA